MKGRRWVLVALGLLTLGATCDWLSAQSKRLYSDGPDAPAWRSGIVEQLFPIHGTEVVPIIECRGEGRFVFHLDPGVPRRLTYAIEHKSAASYEIFFQHGGERRRLIAEKLTRTRSHQIWVPREAGDLEFVTRGTLTWLDLRLVRPVFLWPVYCAIGLGLSWFLFRAPRRGFRRGAEWLLLTITVLLCLGFAEWVLRIRGTRPSSAIAAARSESGLVGEDSRLIDPQRYKIRLRPNLKAHYEWRIGDIARFNFIPREVSPQVRHSYLIQTDAEGFRNDRVREKFEIAALGDSFTDGATGPADESWPARLEHLTHRPVQNYGTSGFGPQQELYVLRDFVLRHRPRVVVLAFCAGNDLSDAEAFDLWEKNPARPIDERPGWRLTETSRRYESLYLWTAGRIIGEQVSQWLSSRSEPAAKASEGTRFDRGMFTVHQSNHIVRFAFFPPYLEKLARPRQEIEESPGWTLTQTALRLMQAECVRQGTKFVLMFIPEKTKVYWPLTERSLSSAELQSAVDFYCRYNQKPPRMEDVGANRLAQNALLHDFCGQEHIPMLDLTAPLQNAVEAGIETYFPDDTHWNAAGHDLAARELAQFITDLP